MLSQLRKDLYKAQCRIFDHHIFVNGEIEAFLNNFECRRNDLEVDSLFKLIEAVGSIKYQLSNQCLQKNLNNVNIVSAELQKTLVIAENILQKLPELKSLEKTWISERRLQRLQQRKQFEKELSLKYQNIDNFFTNKEDEIAESVKNNVII